MSRLSELIDKRRKIEELIYTEAKVKYKNGDIILFKNGNMSKWGRLEITGVREWHGRVDIFGINLDTGKQRKVPYIPDFTIHEKHS